MQHPLSLLSRYYWFADAGSICTPSQKELSFPLICLGNITYRMWQTNAARANIRKQGVLNIFLFLLVLSANFYW